MRSIAYDLDFRERSGRMRDWGGAGLLLLAALLWGWCTILLLTSRVADDWSEALLVLGLSVPVSAAGTALFTIGMVSRRMSAHGQAMRDLDRLAGEAARRPTI